jgi:glycosyltransferase involved in cell wall biosynthesis
MAECGSMQSETKSSSQTDARTRPLKVAWFSYFPIERLPDLPAELTNLPRVHPATWQRVLWDEFKENPGLTLDVIVLRNHFQRDLIIERGNTRFHCVKTPGFVRTGSFYWLDTWLIQKKIKEINPDLLHAWGTEFGAAAVAARLRRLKYPTLITMQGILTWYGSVFPLNTHAKIARFFEPPSLRKAKVITTESSFAMNYLKARYPQARLLQAEHAPNPIFSRIIRRSVTAPLRIICLGVFAFSKGADVAIEALNGLSQTDFEVVWIGAHDQGLFENVRQRTKPELWKRITFKRDLAPEEITREFETATMMLHAARADNSPNSVKEAVVAGLPVIATNTGGIPDYVFPGWNGLLFKSGDVVDCRSKIQEAFAHPLFSKGQVEPAALSQVRNYLSAKTMASNFLNAYEVTLQTYGSSKKVV